MSAGRFSAIFYKTIFLLTVVLGLAASCGGGDSDEDEAAEGGTAVPEEVTDVHEGIYLDTSDGTLWATTNVGAARPYDSGKYFAWAETSAKNEYSLDTYVYAMQTENSLTKYCTLPKYGYNGFTDDEELTELLPDDDAATALWGSQWRTPSLDEWQTLIDECDWTRVREHGKYGYRVSSRLHPERSIFLPEAGRRMFNSSEDEGEVAHYWSRTLDETSPNYAFAFRSSSYASAEVCLPSMRFLGYSVRPVRVGRNSD